MKEIQFNNLSTELKRQFIDFLGRHKIDFESLQSSKTKETKIRIFNRNGEPMRVVVRPGDLGGIQETAKRPGSAVTRAKRPKSKSRPKRAKRGEKTGYLEEERHEAGPRTAPNTRIPQKIR